MSVRPHMGWRIAALSFVVAMLVPAGVHAQRRGSVAARSVSSSETSEVSDTPVRASLDQQASAATALYVTTLLLIVPAIITTTLGVVLGAATGTCSVGGGCGGVSNFDPGDLGLMVGGSIAGALAVVLLLTAISLDTGVRSQRPARVPVMLTSNGLTVAF